MKRANERPRPGTGGAVGGDSQHGHPTAPPSSFVGPVEPPAGRAVPIRDKLLWDLADICALTGLSRRLLECQRSAGKMPQCDLRIGRRALWRPATITSWLDSQAASRGGRS
jgi:hypothetical protein